MDQNQLNQKNKHTFTWDLRTEHEQLNIFFSASYEIKNIGSGNLRSKK